MTFVFLVTEITSANGICTQAVMKEMINRGHHVICLTNRDRKPPMQFVRDRVEYHTIRPRWVYAMQQIANCLAPGRKRSLILALTWALNKVKLLLAVGTWPLISPLYAYRYYLTLLDICMKYQVNAIIPVYSQIDTLIAAHYVKKKQASICIIPYMLDSLSGGYGPKVLSKEWAIKRGLKWENRLFKGAARVLVMESSRIHHEAASRNCLHYDRFVYVDIPLLSPIESTDWFVPFDPKEINLLYVGTLPRHARNPDYLLELFLHLADDRLRLFFIGRIDDMGIINAMKQDNRIRLIQEIPHEESLIAINSANILINLGNNQPTMVPSKVFEYISAGKPIISTVCSNSDGCVHYLNKYPCAFLIHDYGDEKKTVTEELLRFIIANRNLQLDFQTLSKTYKSNSPSYTVDCIESVFEEQSII